MVHAVNVYAAVSKSACSYRCLQRMRLGNLCSADLNVKRLVTSLIAGRVIDLLVLLTYCAPDCVRYGNTHRFWIWIQMGLYHTIMIIMII